MSDSWILIALTILIVFLLFYMSKRLICSGPILTNSNEELGGENVDWSTSPHYCDVEVGAGHPNHPNPIVTICQSTNNNNNIEEKPSPQWEVENTQMEHRLRLQVLITHMILAEKEHKKLELEVTRLARLLVADQGTSSPEECVRNLRNELYPLTSFGSFQSQRLNPHQHRLLSQFPSTFSFVSELTSNPPPPPPRFNIMDELSPSNNNCPCRCGGGRNEPLSPDNPFHNDSSSSNINNNNNNNNNSYRDREELCQRHHHTSASGGGGEHSNNALCTDDEADYMKSVVDEIEKEENNKSSNTNPNNYDAPSSSPHDVDRRGGHGREDLNNQKY